MVRGLEKKDIGFRLLEGMRGMRKGRRVSEEPRDAYLTVIPARGARKLVTRRFPAVYNCRALPRVARADRSGRP
jgi:hypothetical protein